MPVEAARKAPTTTMETAKPPGRGPKMLAILVSSSSAIRDLSRVIPMRTNINTASNVSMDWPAKTLSFMRLTTKDMFRSNATSHPWGNTG